MFAFDITATAGRARAGRVTTDHGSFDTPAFMPVGTAGAVKALTGEQLEALGAQIILANTYHLALRPGRERLLHLGGLHQLANWSRPLLTDSGGYQVLSLSSRRQIHEHGVTFASHLDGTRLDFTPESVLEMQRAIGADIVMPLDVCPSYLDSEDDIARATRLTHSWAEMARAEWERKPRAEAGHSQALFGIVQGGYTESGREASSRHIAGLGFPGWAIGGLVTAEPRRDTWRLVAASTVALPELGPRYLMGVGTPADLVRAVELGVDMFDCVLPTRNARNGTVFTREGPMHIRSARYAEDERPIDPECLCPACRRHSRAYIRHLLATGEITGLVLATQHSVYFYLDLMSRMRDRIREGTFTIWAGEFLRSYETPPAAPSTGKEVTA
jgi:queuine tRNA-ribosyltransferase